MVSAEKPWAIRKGIQAQHRELNRLVRAVHHRLDQPPEAPMLDSLFTRLLHKLRKLQTLLQRHVALVEQGGYLEVAEALVPSPSANVTMLKTQHRELIVAIRLLIVVAEVESDTPRGWKLWCARFSKFSRMLLAHEAAENRILQKGFKPSDAPGLADARLRTAPPRIPPCCR